MTDTAVESPTRVDWGRGRRITFYTAVGLSLASMLAAGPILTAPVTAWLPESTLDAMFGESGLGIHRMHLMGATVAFWITVVAMVAQFRHPERRAAPVWAAAVAWVVFLPLEFSHKIDPYSIVVTALVLAVLALHPLRWPIVPITWRPGPRLLAVPFAVLAGVYAYQQALLQINAIPEDPHAMASHFELMAAAAIGLAASALLGATNFPGHRISAWSAGVLAPVLGVFYIGHPDQMSSVGVGWGALIVVWGVVYLLMTLRPANLANRPTVADGPTP